MGTLQTRCNLYNAQAYERQVEELTRALTCGDESRVDSAKERAALLQQLHGAEQVGLRDMRLQLLDLSMFAAVY